ncbi:metallophosphoesterase [Comamonas serinivorans]|uniref:Metallophosphoesterase n=2 Tax=Comamonas serinivorans TaxID=1082851 RepID=A0A1Y0ETA1_9BURK|nr:metallophosphoesterase [Comamonas serinivorans]
MTVPASASLIQPLPDGPLDVVGDIHGEWDAFQQLMQHLGYDAQGRHPQGRKLIFVGDLCDRGPDSPAVIERVADWVAAGRAWVTIGNHEINLLANDAKDGSAWFFDARIASDRDRYEPYARATDAGQRQAIRDFFASLPVALERDDLRVVHAAWSEPQIQAVRALPLGQVGQYWNQYEEETNREARQGSLATRMLQESRDWPHSLEDGAHPPPFLPAHADKELSKAMHNPIKVLITGVERRGSVPFFAGNKWRFVERVSWWDGYDQPTPVIVGHYWRRDPGVSRGPAHKGDLHMFEQIPTHAWHGLRHNVFCVDYSVGGRWISRRNGQPPIGAFRLAAMRWPERELVFDDGERVPSTAFGA